MLRRLLKYDLKSVWRIWWVMALGVLGLATAGAIVLRFIIDGFNSMNSEVIAVFLVVGILFVGLCVAGVIASYVMTYILVFLRYYKHLFSDEGYLTFTLPVKRKTILLSKTLNAFIWCLAHIALIAVCIMIFLLAIPSKQWGNALFEAYEAVGALIVVLFDWGGVWAAIYVVEGVLAVLTAILFSICLIQFCITVGATIVRRAKIIVAIGIYYGANMIITTVTQILGTFGAMAIAGGYEALLGDAPFAVEASAVSVVIMIVILMISAVTSVLYFTMLGTLERKLNLS